MKRIDRYIFLEACTWFAMSQFAFIVLFVGTEALSEVTKLISRFGLPPWAVLQLLFLRVPWGLAWTMPMSAGMAVMTTMGRLVREQEYTAIVVGGMSFKRMLAPLAVFACLTMGLAAWVQEYLGPKAQMIYYAKKLSLQSKSAAQVRELHLRLNDFGSKRRVALTAESLDTKDRVLNGLSIVVSEEGQKLYETWAQKALWMPEIKHWKLLNGYTQIRGKDGVFRTVNFVESEVSREAGLRGYGGDIVFESEPNTVELVSTDKPDYLTYSAIRERIRWMVDHDYTMREINRVRVYVSRRWTMATSCFLFVLVGAPLAVRPERGAMYKMGGVLALAICLILAYYIIWNATSFLGEGSAYPWAWAWSSNVCALCFGLVLCTHVRD